MLLKLYIFGIYLLFLIFHIEAQSRKVFCRGKRGWGTCVAAKAPCKYRRYKDKLCRNNLMCCAPY